MRRYPVTTLALLFVAGTVLASLTGSCAAAEPQRPPLAPGHIGEFPDEMRNRDMYVIEDRARGVACYGVRYNAELRISCVKVTP